MQPVTDPALLAQLNGGGGDPTAGLTPVTDPDILKQLNAQPETHVLKDVGSGLARAAGDFASIGPWAADAATAGLDKLLGTNINAKVGPYAKKVLSDLGQAEDNNLYTPQTWQDTVIQGASELAPSMITGPEGVGLAGRFVRQGLIPAVVGKGVAAASDAVDPGSGYYTGPLAGLAAGGVADFAPRPLSMTKAPAAADVAAASNAARAKLKVLDQVSKGGAQGGGSIADAINTKLNDSKYTADDPSGLFGKYGGELDSVANAGVARNTLGSVADNLSDPWAKGGAALFSLLSEPTVGLPAAATLATTATTAGRISRALENRFTLGRINDLKNKILADDAATGKVNPGVPPPPQPAPQPPSGLLPNGVFNMGNQAAPQGMLANLRARLSGLLPAPGPVAAPDQSGIQMPANQPVAAIGAPAGMTWSAARNARMNELIAQGLSMKDVAATLSKETGAPITKNSVIGQNWRNKQAALKATPNQTPSEPAPAPQPEAPSSPAPAPGPTTIPADLSIPDFLQRSPTPTITKSNGGLVQSGAPVEEAPFTPREKITPNAYDKQTAAEVLPVAQYGMGRGAAALAGIEKNHAVVNQRAAQFAQETGQTALADSIATHLRGVSRGEDVTKHINQLGAANPTLKPALDKYFGMKWTKDAKKYYARKAPPKK